MILSFRTDAARVNVRVVAVAIRGRDVLLQRFAGKGFWVLPGGRPEVLEPAAEALGREMREELGVEVRVGPLLWIVENFFEETGERFHEFGLYFRVRLPRGSAPLARRSPWEAVDGSAVCALAWHPLRALPAVRPTFLVEGLRRLPPTPRHLVHRDPSREDHL